MSGRANVAVREKGRVRVHYASQGALDVLGALFFGIASAERYWKALHVDERLLDEVDAEAGAVVDMDTRTVLVFGPIEVPLYQQLFVKLMTPSWPGWTVRWADDQQRTLAAQLGLPASLVAHDDPRSEPLDLDELADPYPSRFALHSGLAVVCSPTKPDRYISGLDIAPLVAHGAERAHAVLECLPTEEEILVAAREAHPDDDNPLPAMVSTGLYLGNDADPRIVLAAYPPLARKLAELADVWPAYRLETCAWDLDVFFDRIGRPLASALAPRPTFPLEEQLWAIATRVVVQDRQLDKTRAARFGEVVRDAIGEAAGKTWDVVLAELRKRL